MICGNLVKSKSMISKQTLLIAAVFIVLTSCKQALMKKYGVSKPQIESLESVRKSINGYSRGYDSCLCVFRDSSALVDWFRNTGLPGRSLFFNSSGYRIITQDSAFCSGVETEFAGNLRPGQALRIDSLTHFEILRKSIYPIGEKVKLDPALYDYTCVIFWAKFMGRINEASFAIAASAMSSNAGRTGKVNFIFVCMDIMNFWGVSGDMIRTNTGIR